MTCGGSSCTYCTSSSTTSGTGTISVPANYGINANCKWLIASAGSNISLSFSYFSTEAHHDVVFIYACTSPSCDGVPASPNGNSVCSPPLCLGKLQGIQPPTDTYTSSTGYLQVVFTSDHSVTDSGVSAVWSTAAA